MFSPNKFYKKQKCVPKKKIKLLLVGNYIRRHQERFVRKEKNTYKEKTRKIYLKQKKNIMTKVKIPPEDRIYDRDGYWLRAACVCVKDHSENEVRFYKTKTAVVLTVALGHAC